MREWRLLNHGPEEARINMAVDEAVALACRKGKSPATLRLYTWQPAALSIGYFQDAGREVDQSRCQALGYGFVRRPTGGKAVLHDQELTYSVSLKADDPLYSRDLRTSFLTIAGALLCGLNQLGVQAEVLGTRNRSKAVRTHRTSSICFADALGFEIGVKGKKLIGSAQRRWKEGLLQHGSILCQVNPQTLVSLLKFPSEEQRRLAIKELVERVTCLSSILQCQVDLGQLKQALIKGFEEALKIRLIPSELTPFELELTRTMADRKYGSHAWNLRREQIE